MSSQFMRFTFLEANVRMSTFPLCRDLFRSGIEGFNSRSENADLSFLDKRRYAPNRW